MMGEGGKEDEGGGGGHGYSGEEGTKGRGV